jgi:Flp pilus assembly protein TadB
VSRAALLAFGAGLTGVLAAWEALAAVEATRIAAAARRLVAPLVRAEREGRSPSALERRRLAMVAAGCLLTGGWLVAGPAAGAAAALAGPSLALALVRSRRRRYATDLARGAPAAARALADAIGGGHSVRGALAVAAGDVPGSAGHELLVTARALEHGEPTAAALEALRGRARSRAWDTMVAAILLQSQAGGDLAGLLRDLAASLEGAARSERDAEATTAQARFTAWLGARPSARGGRPRRAGRPGLRSRAAGPSGLSAARRGGAPPAGVRRDLRAPARAAARAPVSPAVVLAATSAALAAAGLTELAALRARRPPTGHRRRPRESLRLPVVALRRLGQGVAPNAAPRDLQLRLDAAGLSLPLADLLAVKAGAALSALLLGLTLAPGLPGRLPLLAVLALPPAAFLVPDAWLRRRIRARSAVMGRELPDVLDLIRVAVAAGLPADRSLAEVGHRHPGLLAGELRRTAGEIALGRPALDAYAGLVRRTPVPGAAVLVGSLARAARHGTALGPTLAAQAEEARSAQARAATEHAARAAPKIQLVIALLLVPSVLLLVAAALIPSLIG